MLGSLHANRDKIIKHIKGLYWSNKVENIRHKFESEGKVQWECYGNALRHSHSSFQNAMYPCMLIPVWRPHCVNLIYFFGDRINCRNTTSDEAGNFHIFACARTHCTLHSDSNLWRMFSVVTVVGGSVINAHCYYLWTAHTFFKFPLIECQAFFSHFALQTSNAVNWNWCTAEIVRCATISAFFRVEVTLRKVHCTFVPVRKGP